MRKIATNSRTIFVLSLALLPALLLTPASAGAGGSKVVAKKAPNTTLNEVVLTNTKGLTLYSLSVEKHGKFICTSNCTALWHPLVVPAGVKPIGPVAFGTVKRPDDGHTQVTFKGRPLYVFSGDHKKGQANGEGFKDVGTWHAARVEALSTPSPEPQPGPKPENPYGY